MSSSSSSFSGKLPKFLERKLKTLKCPQASPTLDDFQRIVLWLEEEKVRLYTVAERAKMREVNKRPQWYRATKEYLKELGLDESLCDSLSDKAPPDVKLKVLDVLTSMAVHDEYQDAIEEKRIKLPAAEEADPNAAARLAKAVELCQLIEPLNKILADNSLPTLTDDVGDDDIVAAVSLLHNRHFPPDVNMSDAISDQMQLETVPIGIELETEQEKRQLQAPIALLRFLHNHNMRDFQQRINETINKLQQFTADPRTDGALGRVGR
ncbi:unnamed protein product [Amoebophrya sp. A120]|nr:unnamed protein product [Amoebophrya sp. A120]|eukprot:GSA120T00012072001.1